MTPPDPIFAHLRTLADWSAGLTPDAVPAHIRRRATLILWDDLGAMLAARDEPEVRALRRKIAEKMAKTSLTDMCCSMSSSRRRETISCSSRRPHSSLKLLPTMASGIEIICVPPPMAHYCM